MSDELVTLEICAGAGGQSLGLEQAGFGHAVAVEMDPDACNTLRHNRPEWKVAETDVRQIDGRQYRGVDLVSGGVPCPPFSLAGKQLGADDERDLFPEALRLIAEAQPRTVLLENVRGLATSRFVSYRAQVQGRLKELGYDSDWQLVTSADFGVPQLRPRFILVGWKSSIGRSFVWPTPLEHRKTVGEALLPYMSAEGWTGAKAWARCANDVGPTLVGGSKKHGGADLGPTRAREGWLRLGVDGRGLADAPPNKKTPEDATPRLTVPMAAAIQGFPAEWTITGRKTAAYRQVGNAFPPPAARAIGESIRSLLTG